MTHQDFKKNFPVGSSVASPEGTYLGECVSYVRQYMALVHGFKSGPIGHAAQIPYNRTFLASYEKVNVPQPGDLMFWGNDAGDWTSIYGHTAIHDGPGYMLNQNYGNSREISRNAIFMPGFIGYFRPKGKGATMPTAQIVKEYFNEWEHRDPTAAETRDYTSTKRTPERAWRYLMDKLLQSQKERLTRKSTALKPGIYEVK